MNLQTLKNKLHKNERGSKFVADLFMSIFIVIATIETFVNELKAQFFFDTLTISLESYEKLLGITPSATSTIEDRRSTVRARWRANGKNSMKLIQDVCDSWKNGEVEAHFVSGKLQIKFVGEYGVPRTLQQLLNEVEEIKPAHWGYLILFKYLLIEDIHEVKTIDEMQALTIEAFASGKEK